MFREIRTPEDLTALVSEFGFLPFFSTEIAGFSIDDLTPMEVWGEYLGLGPWLWRDEIGEKKYSYGTTVYDLPERWLGEKACTAQYHAEPRELFEHMAAHLAKKLPNADRKDIEKLLK